MMMNNAFNPTQNRTRQSNFFTPPAALRNGNFTPMRNAPERAFTAEQAQDRVDFSPQAAAQLQAPGTETRAAEAAPTAEAAAAAPPEAASTAAVSPALLAALLKAGDYDQFIEQLRNRARGARDEGQELFQDLGPGKHNVDGNIVNIKQTKNGDVKVKINNQDGPNTAIRFNEETGNIRTYKEGRLAINFEELRRSELGDKPLGTDLVEQLEDLGVSA